MKPSLIIFQVEAARRRRPSYDQFFAFLKMWCQILMEADLRSISLISFPLFEASDGSRDKLEMPHHNVTRRASERVDFHQQCVSSIDLFVWIWKISTFSPDLAVTWGFWLSEFLCPSACMLYECVTMSSLCIFTWKQKCGEIQASPTELVWNRSDIVSNQRVPKCFLIGMKQDSLPNVGRGTCHGIFFVVIFSRHQKETFSVWDVKECSFALHRILYKPELKCFTVRLGFRLYPIPNANTTSGPILRDQSLLWSWTGTKDFLQSKFNRKEKNTLVILTVCRLLAAFRHDYCIIHCEWVHH